MCIECGVDCLKEQPATFGNYVRFIGGLLQLEREAIHEPELELFAVLLVNEKR